jgi:hypothetical protein
MKLMVQTQEMDNIRDEIDRSLDEIYQYNTNIEDSRPATANPNLINGKCLTL